MYQRNTKTLDVLPLVSGHWRTGSHRDELHELQLSRIAVITGPVVPSSAMPLADRVERMEGRCLSSSEYSWTATPSCEAAKPVSSIQSIIHVHGM